MYTRLRRRREEGFQGTRPLFIQSCRSQQTHSSSPNRNKTQKNTTASPCLKAHGLSGGDGDILSSRVVLVDGLGGLVKKLEMLLELVNGPERDGVGGAGVIYGLL